MSGLTLTFHVMYTVKYSVQKVAKRAIEMLKGPMDSDQKAFGQDVLLQLF